MKVGNGQSQPQGSGMSAMPPAPPATTAPMDAAPAPQDDMMGGGMPMDNMNGGMPPMDSQMGGGQSQFDTNFDAGVEADEDTDPQKYIQQLTGKLSTTLNSFNSENGDDAGLNKYVAKMIVKAATKNMDDTAKKEIIKAINTSQNPEPVDDTEPEQDNVSVDELQPMPDDEQGQDMNAPLQEKIVSKKQIQEIAKRRRR